MELHERNLDSEKRRAVVTGLTNALAKVLKIPPERMHSINVLIEEYDPSTDFAVGGRFVGSFGGESIWTQSVIVFRKNNHGYRLPWYPSYATAL